jgi:hypothetical protein
MCDHQRPIWFSHHRQEWTSHWMPFLKNSIFTTTTTDKFCDNYKIVPTTFSLHISDIFTLQSVLTEELLDLIFRHSLYVLKVCLGKLILLHWLSVISSSSLISIIFMISHLYHVTSMKNHSSIAPFFSFLLC